MIRRFFGLALLACAFALPALASAGTFDNLKNSASSLMSSTKDAQSASSAAGLLSQLGSGSFSPSSLTNVAGVLGYCQKQGYAESATETVKNKLMEKIGGQSEAQKSEGYKEGLAGMLKGDNGQKFDLASIKDSVGKKVCSMLANRAASTFLGQ